MAIDLNGKWKSVDNKTLNIQADGGIYDITQTKDELFISGENKSGGWKNIGHGDFIQNSTIEFYWTDTHSSTSPEKGKEHRCTVEITSPTKLETINISKGAKRFSFGTLEKIDD